MKGENFILAASFLHVKTLIPSVSPLTPRTFYEALQRHNNFTWHLSPCLVSSHVYLLYSSTVRCVHFSTFCSIGCHQYINRYYFHIFDVFAVWINRPKCKMQKKTTKQITQNSTQAISVFDILTAMDLPLSVKIESMCALCTKTNLWRWQWREKKIHYSNRISYMFLWW